MFLNDFLIEYFHLTSGHRISNRVIGLGIFVVSGVGKHVYLCVCALERESFVHFITRLHNILLHAFVSDYI